MENAVSKACKIIQERTASGAYENQYCVIAQADTDGRLTAAPITPAKADGIKLMTFCTGLGSNKVKRIKADNRACVNLCSESYNITLKGKIEILTDDESKRDAWYKGMEQHFTGPDDPNYCVLLFRTERYSLLIDWEETEGDI